MLVSNYFKIFAESYHVEETIFFHVKTWGDEVIVPHVSGFFLKK